MLKSGVIMHMMVANQKTIMVYGIDLCASYHCPPLLAVLCKQDASFEILYGDNRIVNTLQSNYDIIE